MTTYTKNKMSELLEEIKNRKGRGETKKFYELRDEIIEKLGNKEWERIFRKTKFSEANNTNNTNNTSKAKLKM